jgi:hypothetical protein
MGKIEYVVFLFWTNINGKMSKNGRKEETRHSVEEHILDLPREELLTALKNRKGYEPEAEKIIVRESLRRGLIGSEEDLAMPEFNASVRRFSLFPYPDTEATRIRIIRSLMRSLMIPGVIPVYFGILKFGIPKVAEGAALVSAGVIWIGLALLGMLKNERRALWPMFFLLVLSALYSGRLLLAYANLDWVTVFIPIVLYLFAIYALIYSYVLMKGKK